MRYLWAVMTVLLLFTLPVSATQYTAPVVPESGSAIMPDTQSISDAFIQMVQKAVSAAMPDLKAALRISGAILFSMLVIGILQLFQDSSPSVFDLAGIGVISAIVVLSTKSMIQLGMDTVSQISEYGKLLLPVMTAALAAQGGIQTSAALYAGTAMFNSLLSSFLSGFLCPVIYVFLALAIGAGATGETLLKNLKDMVKTLCSWFLKTLLTIFTTYMGITGVISGTTDAASLKATKVAISSVVPVVGSILSDASEAVLISAGLAKNAAGIYGIFAVISVFLVPFLRIGIHYLVLKGTFVVGGVVGSKPMTELIGDFSTAMGLLLAMTGSACLMQLISTVCFLKGVG